MLLKSMNNPLGVSPSKGKRNHTRQRKNLLTSVGIEPTTSRLDLPSLCQLSDSRRGQKIFSLPRVVPCFPLLGLTPSGLFMDLSSTIIYPSESILCSTICVPSATRQNIHMYPYFLFAAIHHLIVPDFLCATL